MGLFKSKKNETPCCSEVKEESACCSGEAKEESACCSGEAKEEMVECDCGNLCPASEVAAKKAAAAAPTAGIKVLGSGCKKCNQLEDAVKQALAELGKDTPVEHVTDFGEIAAYGVMSTPALVVDGKVVSQGKVLKAKELIKVL